MLKQIFDRYDKQLLAALPRALFDGHIEVIVSESAAEKAVKFLLGQPLLGFDTETRPSFVQGRMNKVALLQVCSGSLTSEKGETCFLFRLNRLGLPPCIVRLLEDKTVTKVGLSWHDDQRSLNQRTHFEAGTFIELQDVAAKMGIQDMSLQKLYANIFGQKISKGQQLYAATDAWACVRLYKEMTRMQREGYTLVVNNEL